MPTFKTILFKIVLAEFGFIPAQGSQYDKRDLHLASECTFKIYQQLSYLIYFKKY
jgi:hypothetical protein